MRLLPFKALLSTAVLCFATTVRADIPALLKQVNDNPRNVAAWLQLAGESNYGNDQLYRWTLRRALSFNPGNPDLLLAEANSCWPLRRVDIWWSLEDLAKSKGHEQEGADLIERLTIEMDIWPLKDREIPFYNGWASRLIELKKLDRAGVIIERGLACQGDTSALAGMKIILTALKGNIDEALRLQAAAGFAQRGAGGYMGLGDLLLAQNKSQQTVEAFGGKVPDDVKQKRVLAWALQSTGKSDDARKLLQGNAIEDRLLLMELEVETGRAAEAKQIGAEIVATLQFSPVGGAGRGARGIPRTGLEDAVSVMPALAKAIINLKENFPDNAQKITWSIGLPPAPEARFRGWSEQIPVPPPAELLAQATREFAQAATPEDKRNALFVQSMAYEGLGRYREALDACTRAEFSPEFPGHPSLERWSMVLRRLQARAEFDRSPDKLLLAMPLVKLISYNGDAYGNEMLHKQYGTDEQAVKTLSTNGPWLVSLLYSMSRIQIEQRPGTEYISPFISERTEAPFQVLGKIGNKADVPFVLRILNTIAPEAKQLSGSFGSADMNAKVQGTYVDQVRYLSHCLAELTGEKDPQGTVDEKVAFWNRWLDMHAADLEQYAKQANVGK